LSALKGTSFRDWRNSGGAPSRYADVQVEIVGIMFRKLPGTVLVASIGGIAAILLPQRGSGDSWWIALLAAMAAVCFVRLAVTVAVAFRRGPPLTPKVAARWQNLYGALTVAYAAVLAADILRVFPRASSGVREMFIVGVVSLCAGFNGRMGMRPWIPQISGLVLLAAIGISLLQSPETIARLSFVIVCSFAFVHVRSADSRFAILVEQLRSRRRLRELAECDTLTGLANRRFFHQRLTAECRERLPFAILFIDLDRFKQVNDTLGHAAGDELLRMVAERLRREVRSSDLVARFGGDEFAILQQPGPTSADARALAERINQVIAEPFEIDGAEVRIGASVGVRLSIHREEDPERVLHDADEALYQVKRNQRGGFAFGG